MRVSQEEKGRSHARIVASAARLFRERGLGGANVAEVMNDAGLTHGGFYRHFDSKDELVEKALESAFAEFVAVLQNGELSPEMASAVAGSAYPGLEIGRDAVLATYRALYLSRDHLTQPATGCPVAALGTELARGSTALKAAFGRGVRRMIEALSAKRKGSAGARRTAAIRDFSMMVGAMVIARASDPELADEVLDACGGAVRRDQ